MSEKQTCFVANTDGSVSMLLDGDLSRNQRLIFTSEQLSYSQASMVANILDLAYARGRDDLARDICWLIGITP